MLEFEKTEEELKKSKTEEGRTKEKRNEEGSLK